MTFALAACASGTTKAQQDDAGTEPDAPVVQPPSNGKAGSRIVAGAIKASSPKYKLVGTLTVGDGRTSSAKFTKNGGVVGVTQP